NCCRASSFPLFTSNARSWPGSTLNVPTWPHERQAKWVLPSKRSGTPIGGPKWVRVLVGMKARPLINWPATRVDAPHSMQRADSMATTSAGPAVRGRALGDRALGDILHFAVGGGAMPPSRPVDRLDPEQDAVAGADGGR